MSLAIASVPSRFNDGALLGVLSRRLRRIIECIQVSRQRDGICESSACSTFVPRCGRTYLKRTEDVVQVPTGMLQVDRLQGDRRHKVGAAIVQQSVYSFVVDTHGVCGTNKTLPRPSKFIDRHRISKICFRQFQLLQKVCCEWTLRSDGHFKCLTVSDAFRSPIDGKPLAFFLIRGLKRRLTVGHNHIAKVVLK